MAAGVQAATELQRSEPRQTNRRDQGRRQVAAAHKVAPDLHDVQQVQEYAQRHGKVLPPPHQQATPNAKTIAVKVNGSHFSEFHR